MMDDNYKTIYVYLPSLLSCHMKSITVFYTFSYWAYHAQETFPKQLGIHPFIFWTAHILQFIILMFLQSIVDQCTHH